MGDQFEKSELLNVNIKNSEVIAFAFVELTWINCNFKKNFMGVSSFVIAYSAGEELST